MTALRTANSAPDGTGAPGPAPPRRGRPRSATLRLVRERCILALLIACGVFSLATTVFIIGILATESSRFFTTEMTNAQGEVTKVSFFADFLGDTEWNPLLGSDKHFGIWPLILGTFKIVFVAMAFALPLGLIVAIWLSEYAPAAARSILKPVLEILAGIPTVVFGFFALTFITPLLRMPWLTDDAGNPINPLGFENYNVLSAGLAVGIMCLPIVTSLSEDAIRAVPSALREGSYGLGASRFETSWRVIMPAALSGIVAAFLLAIARAVGETMIVALAAGMTPERLLSDTGSFDPGSVVAINEPTQTMTGFMVQMFTGDVANGTVEYYSSYAVAATLFILTFGITILGSIIRGRFRQAYQ